MNITRLHMTKQLLRYAVLVKNVQRMIPNSDYYSTMTLDAFVNEIFERHKKVKFQRSDLVEANTQAMAFSIMALKDFKEDGVVRLLQTLLKYEMMKEYVDVLQVLFNFKLKGYSRLYRDYKKL
ncbi:uncharacterized protein LOC111350257 [Spodoptera litura]|uniref:Uncharacterized protein LOC111350257 n=1 Tax=Spodoptera litura TaxID=69820 RepID=A0A9J7INH9_SPOLT|nr:uncharacterized protein LOC111350257 [Spodoptera litura]